MKNINIMNCFFTGIPALLITGGWLFDSDIFLIGFIFAALTGVFQVIVGIMTYVDSEHKKPLYAAYLAGVATFFLLWIITNWQWVFIFPPILSIFLSLLLFFDAKKQQP